MLSRIITDHKKGFISAILICSMLVGVLCGCTQNQTDHAEESAIKTESSYSEKRESVMPSSSATSEAFTADTPIRDVINYHAFRNYGRLIFPVNESYFSGSTLGDLNLTWYSEIRPEKTVEICNYMKDHADAGDVIFYDIYTDEEKAADPSKNDTGLFFFRGKPA